MLGAFALRAIRDGQLWLKTGMEVPGFVFLASAVLAAWISYDRGAALLQCERFFAVGILFYAIASRKIRKNDSKSIIKREAELRWVAAGILFLASGLALYWPLHQDYSAAVDKFFLITNLLNWIKAHLPAVPGPTLQSNVAAGALILMLPMGLGLVVDARRRGATLAALLAIIGTVIVLIGLLLTSSRGAWIGLIAAVGLALIIVIQRRWISAPAKWGAIWVTAVLGGMVIIEALILSGKADRLVGPLPDPTGSLQSRITVWSNGPDLIGDYIFTGSGLMTMSRVFSVYELLIPVPYQNNLNNLFLQIWLEQGILGEIALLSMLGVLAGWVWKALNKVKRPLSDTQSILGWAGIVGIIAITFHNFVEVVFYGGRTLPLVGLALGYAYLVSPSIDTTVPLRLLHSRISIMRGIVGGIFVLFCILFYRPIFSAFYANLGAVEQTQMEMSNYNPDNFQKDSLDQVRRRLTLDRVEILLQKSLAWNPKNRVALLRLGDIALSYSDESSAKEALQAAWNAGYRDNRTRLLYGDLLVMQGEVQNAASVQKGIPWAESRMSGQAWYRYWLNNEYRRALDAWQTVLLLDPSNQNARYWSEQAIQRLKKKNQ